MLYENVPTVFLFKFCKDLSSRGFTYDEWVEIFMGLTSLVVK